MSARLSTLAGRHAQTALGSLGRILEKPLAALMTMAVIAVALALPLLLAVFLQNVRAVTSHWNQAFDLSVYLDGKSGTGRTDALAQSLRARADVAAVRVVTADAALAEFKRQSGFGAALDALKDNPLPDTLIVSPAPAASTAAGAQTLRTAIAALPDVSEVQLDTLWIERLQAILTIVRRVLWIFGGLLSVGVVLVIGNTIRLDILNRRTEIEVMKLVGATDTFTRRPFLYGGLWYGLGSGALSVMLVAVAVLIARPAAEHLAELYGGSFALQGLGFANGLAVIALSMALGWLGSWLSATRHIRAIEP